ncbi:MAG: beta-Ala-His dipeptidase, partial [Anaerovoracaceae bacterium]
EAVITVDEEIGLLGAYALDASKIHARRMINIDSEEEGIITVGCGGGCEADVILPVTREKKEGLKVTLTVDGLKGGHSGAEIDKERGNANIIMGRALYDIRRSVPFSIISVAGGTKNNAICKACEAELLIENSDYENIEDMVKVVDADLKHEYRNSDAGVTVSLRKDETGKFQTLTEGSQECVMTLLMNAPQGIQHMSTEIKGLVDTSLNLGVLSLGADDDELSAKFCVRSAVSSRKHYIVDKIDSLTTSLGGYVNIVGDYPSWEYRDDSPLRDKAVEVYKKQYGEDPRVEAIHAGLECGLFAGKLGDDFDAISIGPDMEGVHTTEEKLSISSAKRVWTYVTNLLEALK